ncbi:hypothetical protein B0H34DRAFT_807538 [Crassisporium funariophilum]|nr:hypothetical protein B0H34DRAFT_807538 [Crassisporium funariophilum]
MDKQETDNEEPGAKEKEEDAARCAGHPWSYVQTHIKTNPAATEVNAARKGTQCHALFIANSGIEKGQANDEGAVNQSAVVAERNLSRMYIGGRGWNGFAIHTTAAGVVRGMKVTATATASVETDIVREPRAASGKARDIDSPITVPLISTKIRKGTLAKDVQPTSTSSLSLEFNDDNTKLSKS